MKRGLSALMGLSLTLAASLAASSLVRLPSRDTPAAAKTSQTDWWSLRPVVTPKIPAVRNIAWVKNPIDAFVLAALEKKGLSPAPPADRRTLVRRVTFDLTGLPPTPEEIAAFLADRSPDAYEKLVDRLLANPRYGERWGRHWLDVARFAESQGFERDILRDHAWRYRDYVIKSFNDDKPYDQFVKEQIAGDVLETVTQESIVATGFLVAGPWDEVGHTVTASKVLRDRTREDELEDIVAGVGQTFLGMTVNCARCHDHKFDPIPQRDYYRLKAAFDGVQHGTRSILTPAEKAAREKELKELRATLARLDQETASIQEAGRLRVIQARGATALPAVRPVAQWTFEGGITDSIGGIGGTLNGDAVVANGRLKLNGSTAYFRSAPLRKELREKTLEAWVVLDNATQRGGSALSIETPGGKAFDGLVFGEREPGKWIAGSNFFVRTRDLDGPPETDVKQKMVHIAATYAADGTITLFRNGRMYGSSYRPEGEAGRLVTYPGNDAVALIGLRHTGANGFLAGEVEEARVYDRALTPEEIAASYRSGVQNVPYEAIEKALTQEERIRLQEATTGWNTTHRLIAELEAVPLAYAANPEKPPITRVLGRGDVESPGEVVSAGGLSAVKTCQSDFGLAPDASDADRRRKLAAWMADPANPLTARVMVNRVWHYHFGRGIVGTPNDFGFNGDRPTHPELLDWLATRFVGVQTADAHAKTQRRKEGQQQITTETQRHRERLSACVGDACMREGKPEARRKAGKGAKKPTQAEARSFPPYQGGTEGGAVETAVSPSLNPKSQIPNPKPWSLKDLHRLILLSNTYRQSSQPNPRATAVDADDHLLWRFAPRRLEAEPVRDAMLAVGGNLNPKMGGPSFQPFSVYVHNSSFYTLVDKDEPEFNRRSVYRMNVNSARNPLLDSLDCPDPSTKTPRRAVTTTPLQALELMNNSFVLRQSGRFAERVQREAGPDATRQVGRAFELALGRSASPSETERSIALIRKAGLKQFCWALYNTSEFLTVK